MVERSKHPVPDRQGNAKISIIMLCGLGMMELVLGW
jgi:hypothetical protein